jgi:hypothetical protein
MEGYIKDVLELYDVRGSTVTSALEILFSITEDRPLRQSSILE